VNEAICAAFGFLEPKEICVNDDAFLASKVSKGVRPRMKMASSASAAVRASISPSMRSPDVLKARYLNFGMSVNPRA
jgi:hypothetical protein